MQKRKQKDWPKTIEMTLFRNKYRMTDERRDAIFSGRKELMEELYATGIPIYCDQSYYVHEKQVDLVEKNGDHFKCSYYNKFEDWRECHYYCLCVDADGNKVWLMTGGRYD